MAKNKNLVEKDPFPNVTVHPIGTYLKDAKGVLYRLERVQRKLDERTKKQIIVYGAVEVGPLDPKFPIPHEEMPPGIQLQVRQA